MNSKAYRSPSARSLMVGISSLYAYIYCLLASNELTMMPIFGGAMYMCGQVATEFFSAAIGPASELLPKSLRRWRRAILIVLMLMSVFLVIIYPLRLSSFQLWTVLVIVLAMLLRDEVARRLIHMRTRGGLTIAWFSALLALAHILPALAVLWDFLFNLDAMRGWTMFAAYGIADALALYIQIRDVQDSNDQEVSEQEVREINATQETLGKANAFRAYQALSTAIVIALVVSVVLVYTNVLLVGQDMLIQMALAVLSTLVTREISELLFSFWNRRKEYRPNLTYVMLFGLLLWFSAINSLSSVTRQTEIHMLSVYFCLCMMTAGSTLTVISMHRMEEAIDNVARYADAGIQRSSLLLRRAADLELARLLGNMISLIIIAVLFYLGGMHSIPSSVTNVQVHPLLLVPALIMVVISIVCAFRFPLSEQNMDKLDRFLHLRDEGKSNKALQSQIEQLVMQEHRQPFGTAFVKFMIRVLYPHRIKGRENIRLDDDNPLVFLCNHGDIYGPLVCAAWFPVPMRPWVISQVCTTVEEFSDYFCKYNLARFRCSEKWKRRIAWQVGRLSMWCMRQLECIPVYRDHPMELIKTFRASVDAMQAGDNLLIFPENPNAVEKDHGYEHDGLGELFDGFMMLATIYYRRTRKACRFMPMYAHKGTRTLCFGNEVVYNPKAEDEETERIRVVKECEKEMRRLMQEQDALTRKK
ncbi:MAG: hypothetical protein K6A68_08345 [Clostridiales bacterium]|nr:hypothetical protein [Clostridiales bacterium]